jgi:hypothetical protein
MNKEQLLKAVSGLGEPSKMPCHSYSISAFSCKTGAKLRDIEGSVCSTCYACKGNYTRFPKIQACLNKREEIMLNDSNWINNMVELINRINEGYFRWFDSGDIQSVKNLTDILEVCKQTPNTKHWLPTREHGMVSEYIANGGVIPSNVTLRLSRPIW